MEIIRSLEEMKRIAAGVSADKSLGMVPTMGALHDGHGSLIKKCRAENDTVVVSVFVNPIQFGPGEDYEAYPRDLEADAAFCESLGVDYLFHPDESEMYPAHFGFRVVPPASMIRILCGITRPDHFQGVATVLTKFFSLIRPDRAYFGQKDVQQLAIVEAMVSDLNLGTTIVPCPIIREADGLAKSSRNSYLSAEERDGATVLSRSIRMALDAKKAGERNVEALKKIVVEEIEKEPFAKIDYVEILRFPHFERDETVGEDSFIAMAVYIGNTRLIDNAFFSEA